MGIIASGIIDVYAVLADATEVRMSKLTRPSSSVDDSCGSFSIQGKA